jgi:DNA-binding transcriptional MocR family regulator
MGTEARYERLAASLAADIRSGKRVAGERLPSVRELARLRHVSINTAIAALRRVEQLGLTQVRPQAGYFVCASATRAPEIAQVRPSRQARSVAVNQLIATLSNAVDAPENVPLGTAVPEASWFPFKTLAANAARSLRAQPENLALYGELAGVPKLRNQIRSRYRDLGCHIDQEELLITNGCLEGLNLALRAVAKPGAVIAVESPAYFGFLQIIEGLGMKALALDTDPNTGLSVQGLETVLASRSSSRPDCLLLASSFSNPSGATIPEASKATIVRLCADYEVPIIEDDIFGELHFHGSRPLPLKSFDRRGQVILCSSFSKTLAPGSRIGWVAAGAWADAIRLGKLMLSQATATPMQHAISQYLQEHRFDRHLSKLRATSAEHIQRFSEAIDRHFPVGTRISRPIGGYVLWVQLPKGSDAELLHERANHNKISILPGTLFSTGNEYRNCIRINCARTWTNQVATAIKQLGQLAAEL